jgi:hypothetical protein
VLATAVGLCTGLVCGICGGLAAALIQSATRSACMGRVGSVMSPSSFGLARRPTRPFGAAAAAWGLVPVFLAGAALAAVGVGGVGSGGGLAVPAVRTAELPRTARG